MWGCSGFVPAAAILACLVLPWSIALLQQPIRVVDQLVVPSGTSKHSNSDGSTYDNLLWFAQVSDVHLSRFDPSRLHRFRQFVEGTVPSIKPSAVLFSGDITDARRAVFEARSQNPQEWEAYTTLLRGARGSSLPSSLPWLDVRGNHDAFNVPWLGHSNDYFAKSQQAPHGIDIANSPHFQHTVNTSFGRYKFVGIDAVVNPAPTRHFYGRLTDEHIANISKHLTGDANVTIVFGHYPLNSVVMGAASTPASNFLALLHQHRVVAYLSGHLHQIVVVGVPFMEKALYGRHPTGLLELELGDFKLAHLYRVGVIDNDMFTFKDFSLGQWPIAVVASPKEARYLSPYESLETLTSCTHVRVLAFTSSDATVTSVKISLRGKIYDAHPAEKYSESHSASLWTSSVKTGPLWVFQWPEHDNRDTLSGLQRFTVTVTDSLDRVYSTEHVFSMDGSVASMPVFSQWFMTGNFRDGAQTAADFASASILVLMFIVPFVMVRRGAVPRGTVAAHTLGLSRKPEATSTSQNGPSAVKLEWWDEYLLRFHASPHAFTLSGHLSKWLGWNMFVPYVCLWRSRPGMCWALAGAVVYMYVGPWCVGHLYNDSIGVLFAWGIVSTSGFLPHLDACLYLNMTMWLVIGPLTHLLAASAAQERLRVLRASDRGHCDPDCADSGRCFRCSGGSSVVGVCCAVMVTGGFFLIVLLSFAFHGFWDTIVGPGVSWLNTWALFAAWQAVVRDCRRIRPANPSSSTFSPDPASTLKSQ